MVTQTYDAIGRVSQIASGGTNYLTSVTYNAAHQPESFNYGNGVVADPAYNSRLQLASLTYTKNTTKLLDLAYSYTSATHTGNNGQITRVQDNTGTQEAGRTADYTYDAWSRLKTAVTTGSATYPQWGLSWDYDRYGNRKNQNVTAGSAPAPQLAISPTTNRITSTGYAYDASGNLTNDTLYTYTFDAENRIKEVKQGSTVLSTSIYDGSSLRVKKVAGSTTTRYIFSGAKVVAEYINGALSTEYIYAGSQLLATLNSSGTPTYVHADHLSARVFTNTSGTKIGERGHLPFGEVRYDTMTADKWKFTSYERDPESSLDYAIFRYDSSKLGRFQTPDPLAGSIWNPQSLNRYAYVLNDPINLIDPLGLQPGCTYECHQVCTNPGGCGPLVCELKCPPQPPGPPPQHRADYETAFEGLEYPRRPTFIPAGGPGAPEPPQPEKPKPQTKNPQQEKCIKDAKSIRNDRLDAWFNTRAYQISLSNFAGLGGGIGGTFLVGPLGGIVLAGMFWIDTYVFIDKTVIGSDFPGVLDILRDYDRMVEDCKRAYP